MIELKKITKTFGNQILFKDFSLIIEDGEFMAITGESGKGKTTLLNIISLLDTPTSGEVIINGKSKFTEKEILLLQRNKFAYLFQNYALIENETVLKNMEIALKYKKNCNKRKEIETALAIVGLNSSLNKKVFQLSGGEQQKVALARAFIKEPQYIFADEPTGNLDKKNRDAVFLILREMNDMGKTVIYVTHDIELAKQAKKNVNLS